MQHSHLDFNCPLIFLCVAVLFAMGNFTGLVPELALRGFACHPGPDGARLSLCWFPVAGFRLKIFRHVRKIFFEKFPLAATTNVYVYFGGSNLRASEFNWLKEQRGLVYHQDYKCSKEVSYPGKRALKLSVECGESSEHSPPMHHTKLRLKIEYSGLKCSVM